MDVAKILNVDAEALNADGTREDYDVCGDGFMVFTLCLCVTRDVTLP